MAEASMLFEEAPHRALIEYDCKCHPDCGEDCLVASSIRERCGSFVVPQVARQLIETYKCNVNIRMTHQLDDTIHSL